MAKQFQRLPVECVSLCGENIGIPISQEVEDILAEDVSYRSRQITNVRRKCNNKGWRPWHLCVYDYNTEYC